MALAKFICGSPLLAVRAHLLTDPTSLGNGSSQAKSSRKSYILIIIRRQEAGRSLHRHVK